MRLNQQRPSFDSDEEEFSLSSETIQKKKGKKSLKRSETGQSLNSIYAEASSDDEFAREHLIYPSDDEKRGKKSKKRNRKSKTGENGMSESESDDDNGEKVVYRIQFILGKASMPQKYWRRITDGVNTRELTNFSVWQQPDEEYYDESDTPVEKFLIKWAHASFLHLSWETEKDLVDMVGSSARHHIKRFRQREFEGTELFEDLSKGEYFPQSYVQIERILDVDDPDVHMLEVDWENAPLPPSADPESNVMDDDNYEVDEPNGEEKAKRTRKKRKVSKKAKMNYLHGDSVWLTVKWEGLAYSEVTFESLKDIISRGIEYESQMRKFFRREQMQLVERSGKVDKSKKRGLLINQSIIGSDSKAPSFPAGELRDYQWEGVRWMLFNLVQDRNCILADEMGLGKTIQSAALLQMIKNHQKHSGPFLVIAPLSTIVNWQREISAWTDLDAILYYGSQEDRDLIRSYEFKFLDKNRPGYKIEVIITTPETCVAVDDKSTTRIRRELSSIDWDLIIVDEAHKLKNYDSKIASTLREEYSFQNCVLLTGTPLQNNTEELWNLLHFIAREDFDDRDAFIADFGELKTATQLEQLHKRIKPYLLRREKEYVEKTVPPKEEVVIEIELTVPQKQYYRAIYEQKTGFLYKAGAKDGPSLTNLAMELRKCCNHPFLIKGAAKELSKHFSGESHIDILVKTSGKMTLLDKLLPKLQRDGHRVLIFSQFRMMLDLIEDYLVDKRYAFDRVDGSIVGKKRQAAIDRFTNNDQIFIMLLSTRAGGVGINLTAADTVIIFDSDWNPQNDIQAQARAHRIGQTRPVTVYRLLTKKTYEMVMFRAASIKLGLDYAIMHNLKGTVDMSLVNTTSSRPKRGAAAVAASQLAGISAERADHVSSLSRKELENLLKHGAYDMFLEEKEGVSEKESNIFVESSIEQILEKSSTFLHSENDTQVECTKTSSFAKASFVSAAATDTTEAGEEVAIDDPDFWSKVVGLSVEDMAIQLGAKRKCRQFVESYREPTDSIRSIYGSRSAAYATDSDDSDNEEKGGKRKRRKKAEPEIVPAEFTSETITAVLSAAVGYGFGNWRVVRKQSKMHWKEEDLATAVRWGLLYLLLAVSVQAEAPTVSAAAASTAISAANPSEDSPTKNKLEEVDDCNREQEGNKDSSTAMEVEEKEKEDNVDNTESTEAASNAPSSVELGGIKYDLKSLSATINKYRGLQLALKAFFSPEAVMEVQLLDQFKEFLNEKHFEELTVLAIKAAYKEFIQLSYDSSETCEKIISDIIQNEHIQTLLAQEKDLMKSAKKAAIKAKISTFEDVFECQLFDTLVNLSPTSQVPSKDVVTVELDTQKEENEEQVDKRHQSKKLLNDTLLAIELDKVTMGNDAPTWWDRYYDIRLLSVSAECGLPDSKKRYNAVLEGLKTNAKTDSDEEKAVQIQRIAQEAAQLRAEEEKRRQKEKEKEEKEKLESSEGMKMDVVEEEPNQTVTEAINNNSSEPSEVIPTTVFDELNSKFLVQRLKSLCRHLRCTDEDQQAIEKAALKAAKAAEKAEKAAEKAALKAEKSLAAAIAAEKNQRKKNVTNLLKTVLRIGYPRSSYENLPHPERLVDPSYLLTWEELMKEAEVTLTIEESKTLIYEAIQVFNRLEEFTGKEIISEEGILADIPVKLIEPTFEKTDLIHQIRLLLSFHSEVEIVELIREHCKITGPTIPTYKRDVNLPVWWTQVYHDIQLLKLSIQNGCSQWKKVVTEPAFLAPEDYVVPPKVNGKEWILQANPKALETRLFHLLRGMPAMKDFPVNPPSSPQKKMTANNKNVIVRAPAAKGILRFSNTKTTVSSATLNSTPLPNKTVSTVTPATPEEKPVTAASTSVTATETQVMMNVEQKESVIEIVDTPGKSDQPTENTTCVSETSSPSKYIDHLRSMTEEVKQPDKIESQNQVKKAQEVIILDEDDTAVLKSSAPPTLEIAKQLSFTPKKTMDVESVEDSNTSVMVVTPHATVTPSVEASAATTSQPTTTKADDTKKTKASASTTKKKKNDVPSVQSKNIMQFFGAPKKQEIVLEH